MPYEMTDIIPVVSSHFLDRDMKYGILKSWRCKPYAYKVKIIIESKAGILIPKNSVTVVKNV